MSIIEKVKRIPNVKNLLKPELEHWWVIKEIRANEVCVSHPLGDDRYEYFIDKAEFDL